MLDLHALTGEFVQRMQQHYGDRLARVVLYGSYARGDFHEESDVDLMVLRDEKISDWKETVAIVDQTYDLALKYSVVISSKPVVLKKYEQGPDFFFEQVNKYGVNLYITAA